jgi:hypothetical protein
MAFSWRSLFRKQSASPVQTKGLTIIDDGFIPRDAITLAEAISGAGRASEGLDANVVMAPVAWIMRTFPDATARVKAKTGEDWDWVERHDVERLIRRPNDWYNGDALWQATTLSYTLNGNAYWHKVRNSFGQAALVHQAPRAAGRIGVHRLLRVRHRPRDRAAQCARRGALPVRPRPPRPAAGLWPTPRPLA